MTPVTVPIEDRRVVLRSFGAVMAIACGAGLWLLAWFFHLPMPWAFGLAGLTTAGLVFLVNQTLARRFYHAWNRRIATRVGEFGSAAVLRICLFVIFTAVGRSGSRFQFSGKNSTSMWLSKKIEGNQEIDLIARQATPGWIKSYLRWAFQSGNVWAIVLVPLFCLLRMLSVEQERATGGDIYTLF